MTRITIEVEFEIDDLWGANSADKEEKDWFWNEILPDCMVLLHNNEIGDTVSQTNYFTIKEKTFNTKEK